MKTEWQKVVQIISSGIFKEQEIVNNFKQSETSSSLDNYEKCMNELLKHQLIDIAVLAENNTLTNYYFLTKKGKSIFGKSSTLNFGKNI
jgi:hypothetical protein